LTLENLATLDVEPCCIACCDVPAVNVGDTQVTFPFTLARRAKLTVAFEVTYDCPDTPLRNRRACRAQVAIAEINDETPNDDTCPHAAPPGGVDPIDPSIKDKLRR